MPRRGFVGSPTWTGTRTDTRIAYLAGPVPTRELRLVAGDGTDDRLLARRVAPVAPAWRPGPERELAFVRRSGRLDVVAAESGALRWRARAVPKSARLEWSADGRRLLVADARRLRIYDARGQLLKSFPVPPGFFVVDGAFASDGRVAYTAVHPTRDESRIFVAGARPRQLFAGPGGFASLRWSPDGRRLVFAWPEADQLVFLSPTQNEQDPGCVERLATLRSDSASHRLVLRAGALTLAAAALLASAAGAETRQSFALGEPWNGKLANGVQLTREGPDHFTWDPVRKQAPNRPWRRWGTSRLVATVLAVLAEHRAAHPEAPRVGVGDLSRPRGGDFGARFGGIGHASHQNGLDVDVYYPRRDGQELAPQRVAQIDRRLAQDLVDRFVRAGAVKVFVGPRTGLRGPSRIVRKLVHHDDHIHVRLANDPPRRVLLGRSAEGRAIHAYRLGNPAARRLLVVGTVHGNEPAGMRVTQRLLRATPPLHAELWVVPNLNPDGLARGTRANAAGADLNRDFGRFSQPETRIARTLIRRLRPWLSVWYHQPQGLVRAYGPSVAVGRRYAALARERYRTLVWPPGTAARWQNSIGQRSFVVELGPRPLRGRAAARHVRALLAFAG